MNAQADIFGDEVATVVSAEVLADCLSVSRPTISKFMKEGMPKIAFGKFDMKACVSWYVSRITEKAGGGDGDSKINKQKLKLVEAQTEKVNLENERSRKEVLPIDLVARTINEIGSIISTQLDGLAPRCSSQLSTINDPALIQQELFNECRDIRNNIANSITEFRNGLNVENDGGDNTPTETKDSGSVGRSGKNIAARKPRARKVAKQSDTVL